MNRGEQEEAEARVSYSAKETGARGASIDPRDAPEELDPPGRLFGDHGTVGTNIAKSKGAYKISQGRLGSTILSLGNRMARLGHGDPGSLGQDGIAPFVFKEGNKALANFASSFGYMFSAAPQDRPGDADRLPDDGTVVAALDALGLAMGSGGPAEPDPREDQAQPGDGTIPAAYTYLGQFIDHDITLTIGGNDIMGAAITPLGDLTGVTNLRTPLLELDSVYGPTPGVESVVPAPNGAKMAIGRVTDVGRSVPGKSPFNDVPRKGRSSNADVDREARIGDPRNDENLIVQQLHLAFLKAHNTLADQLGTFAAAREALILMYQAVVVDDFLPRICDAVTLGQVLQNGNRFFQADGPTFMPVEFAAAGYRFGHSLIRENYDFNRFFSPFGSNFMFVFTALSGQLGDRDTFPSDWVIEWDRFLSLGGSLPQRARPIDPQLTPVLGTLRDTLGQPMQGNVAPRLAIRNLRRGYMLALPTGQAVAARMGTLPITIDATSTGLPAAAVAPFAARTPLWLYVLAEAKANSGKLGVVGTTIVAETLIGLIRRSRPSIFDSQGRRLSTTRHALADIIKLADLQD
jgi:hypothetical protein